MYKSSIKTKRTHCSTPFWKKFTRCLEQVHVKSSSKLSNVCASSMFILNQKGQGPRTRLCMCVYSMYVYIYIYISIYIYKKRTYKRVKFTVAIILPKMALHLQGPLLETTMITPTKMQKHKEQEWKMLATETMPGHDETAIDS